MKNLSDARHFNGSSRLLDNAASPPQQPYPVQSQPSSSPPVQQPPPVQTQRQVATQQREPEPPAEYVPSATPPVAQKERTTTARTASAHTDRAETIRHSARGFFDSASRRSSLWQTGPRQTRICLQSIRQERRLCRRNRIRSGTKSERSLYREDFSRAVSKTPPRGKCA